MYFNSIISFVLIFVIHLTNEQEPGSFEVREHSLARPYPSVFSTSNSFWHLTGNTIATDRYIRLTSDTQSKAGGLWNIHPIKYPDWEIHIHFRVHGDGTSYFGDGFAFWYVRDAQISGPVFGYQDYFYGLAIVMDTYANQNSNRNHVYPYISAIINNGSLHYDHDRDGTDLNIAGCESPFRGRTKDTLVAIRYQNDRLTISTDIEGTNSWTECFSINDIHLPTNYYFGFTAATGQLSDNHDIISVHTYQLDSNEQRQAEDRKHIIPSAPSVKLGDADRNMNVSQTTSWSALKIFFLVILLIILCLCGIGAFYYMKSQRYRSSRLY